MTFLRAYLNKYSPREQAIIIGLVIVVAIWLVYFVVIEPIGKWQETVHTDFAANTELLSWMQESADKVGVQDKRADNTQRNYNNSAVVAVETSLKQSGLPTPTRIEPDGSQKAVVGYDAVSFDDLIKGLDRLQHNYDIHVFRASFTPTGVVGQVEALLYLNRN